MKILRNLLIASIALMPLAGFSQIQKGAGSIGLNGTLISDDSSDSITASFLYDYFVSDKLSIGVISMLSYADVDLGDFGSSDMTMLSLGLTATYYLTVTEKGAPYIGAGIGGTYTELGDFGDSTDFSYQVYGGYEAFLTERTSLDMRITYEASEQDSGTYDRLRGTIGFKFYFN